MSNKQPVIVKNKTSKETALRHFYDETAENKIAKVIKQFEQVLRANRLLGWLTDLNYQVIQVFLYDKQTSESGMRVYLKPRAPVKNGWLCLGESSDIEAMQKLLASGWPKYLKIEILIHKDSIQQKSSADIAFKLAEEMGTNFAPCSTLIEKSLIRNKLSSRECNRLPALFDRKGVQHRKSINKNRQALHAGYLTPFSRNARIEKPEFRSLIKGLCQTFFRGAESKYLWRRYCETISQYHPLTGKKLLSKAKIATQCQFYTALEAYQSERRSTYPLFSQLQARRALFFIFLSAMILTVSVIDSQSFWISVVHYFTLKL